MRKLSKILLSSVMLVASAISFATTTYAFVVINKDVDVEEFDFNLETDSGILLSLDGENFSQNISLDKIKAQIEENTQDKYESILYEGVTLSQTAGKINFDSNGYPILVKDKKIELQEPVGDIKWTHGYQETEANDYLAFDLTFRLVTQGDVQDDHILKFTDITGITGTPANTILNHGFSTTSKEYKSGDSVLINPANAMRMGVVTHKENEENSFVVYENVDENDLGSAAIENGTGKNDKMDNLMYQYHNVLFDFEPFTQAAEDGEAFDTLSEYQENILGEFVYDQATSKYNDIKLTIVIWLEGWDADYIVGVPVESTKLKINLGFETLVK